VENHTQSKDYCRRYEKYSITSVIALINDVLSKPNNELISYQCKPNQKRHLIDLVAVVLIKRNYLPGAIAFSNPKQSVLVGFLNPQLYQFEIVLGFGF
jgi:hypothetical protein